MLSTTNSGFLVDIGKVYQHEQQNRLLGINSDRDLKFDLYNPPRKDSNRSQGSSVAYHHWWWWLNQRLSIQSIYLLCHQSRRTISLKRASTLQNNALTPHNNKINKNVENVVQDLNYHGRPENSSKALELKKEEWLQYCDKIFPHNSYWYLVTSYKAYRFIWYQMFCE